MKVSFELLFNEILFEIFDYLDDINILQLFYGLNCRFTNLILNYFRVSPRLNLQSITKTDFDVACKYFIPYIADKLHGLRLSNNEETPQQIDLFLSYGLTLHKFTNLKSLSLNSMHSEKIINRMMIEWQYPCDLTHLSITNCQVLNDWNIVYSLINNIWSLPKLTHCQLDIGVIDETYSLVPNITSSSIQSLSITGLSCSFSELIHLFQHTPCLRYLAVTVNETSVNQHLSFSLPLLTTLKLSYTGPFDILENLLENTPNLLHLTMRITDTSVEEHQWAQIINTDLCKLKTFHFLMRFDNPGYASIVSQLIKTYKSPFWLQEHKWYVQGYSYNKSPHNVIVLYTLPYTFDDYHIPDTPLIDRHDSYCSNYTDQLSYDHVRHLSCESIHTNNYISRSQFSYVCHLALTFPLNNNFWTLVPTVNQLRTLDISLLYTKSYNKHASFQLQTLFGLAPKLYALNCKSSIDALLPLLESTSNSIVKLDFRKCVDYFNYSNCATLLLTSLGKQCQILSIKVNDRMNILLLIKEMPQLRSLNVEYLPDKHESDLASPYNNKLIKWLQHRLPTTCAITRDSSRSDTIQIWIR